MQDQGTLYLLLVPIQHVPVVICAFDYSSVCSRV